MAFAPARKKKKKLRLCLVGPPGSGKTKSALRIADGITSKIAAIDTENGSASIYSPPHEFDCDDLKPPHTPERYIEKIDEAEKSGYELLIIDSLSHAWMGEGALLEIVENITRQSSSGNSYTAWAKATPRLRKLIERILGSSMHIIITLRSKMAYAQEKDERTGKMTIRKLGMEPVMRDGIEYEFDLVGDLDQENRLSITKSRCEALNGAVIDKPGQDLGKRLLEWLDDGAEPVVEADPIAPAIKHAQSLVESILSADEAKDTVKPINPAKKQTTTVPTMDEMQSQYKAWPKEVQEEFQELAKRKKDVEKMNKGDAYAWAWTQLIAEGKISNG